MSFSAGVGFVPKPDLPMMPDHSVVWHHYEIPSLEADLYIDPAHLDLRELVIKYALSGADAIAPEKHIGRGSYSEVAREGGTAIKVSNGHEEGLTYSKNKTGLNALRANVIMHAGLERQADTMSPSLKHQVSWSAPRPYAGYIPRTLARATPRKEAVTGKGVSTWAMSFEEGTLASREDAPPIPSQGERMAIYRAAAASCGLDPSQINYDDARADGTPYLKNTLASTEVKGRWRSRRQITRIVKLDVMAEAFFEW